MTKEERVEKWFHNIPNAEGLNIETKMEICSKIAKKMLITFFVIFALECVLLFIVSRGEIFNHMADFLNNISEGSHSRNHYKGIALIGTLVCLPLIILPLVTAILFKNKWIKSEVNKIINNNF